MYIHSSAIQLGQTEAVIDVLFIVNLLIRKTKLKNLAVNEFRGFAHDEKWVLMFVAH